MNLLNTINPACVFIISTFVGMITILCVVVAYRQSVNAIKNGNDLYERSQE